MPTLECVSTLNKNEVQAEINEVIKAISQIKGVLEVGLFGSCSDWLDGTLIREPHDIDLLVVLDGRDLKAQSFIDICEEYGYPLELDIKITDESPYWPTCVDTICFSPDKGYYIKDFEEDPTYCGKDFFADIKSLWRRGATIENQG